MNNPITKKSISRYVKLKDYKVFDYEIPEIFLDFVIKKNAVYVTTKLKLVKKNKNTRNIILFFWIVHIYKKVQKLKNLEYLF